MTVFIEPILYLDLQRARPICFCPVCGSEAYGTAVSCPRCERRAP